MQLVSSENPPIKKLVIIHKSNLSKKVSPLLLLTFSSILGLHSLLSKTTTSILMFINCVLLGCVMAHGIILKYDRNCMDIHFSIYSKLEENTYDLMCAIDTYNKKHLLDGIMIISVIVPMLTNYLGMPLIYLTAACFFAESEGVYDNAKLGIL